MEIRPFRGLRYSVESDDISSLIAPPYDVLTGEDKDALLSRDERNIVGVDLPHVPPRKVGPDAVYQAAADKLAGWISQGIIRREDAEAIYIYEQTYTWAGKTYTRRAMIAGVRATELGKDVIPHEHTFAGPKADRLKLTEYTRTQLSPIFGFYEDPAGLVKKILAESASAQPKAHGQMNDVGEKLWTITDPDTVSRISSLLGDKPVFIADGHHRYTTTMNYRDALLAEGKIDENHPANFVMFVLVSRDDPGLLVLPTHRVVSNLKEDFSIEKLIAAAGEFGWQKCSLEDIDLSDADAALKQYGKGAMGFIGANPNEMWIAALKDPQAMVQAAPDEVDAWRNLDVAILHKLILEKALLPWKTDQTTIDYTPDGQAALDACKSGKAQLSACLQSTPIEAVEQIALAGASMPHKSTYFYPKLATGIVLKPLK